MKFNYVAYWHNRRISQRTTSSEMPTPLSVDLRWRIVWMNVYEGTDYAPIADVLLISPSTACRIVSLFRVTGDVLPKDQQHGPNHLLGRQEEELVVEWFLENPGI